ncbi:MAG: hypothetical protein KGI55_11355, partial [Gammaproteobacteria bacterium]|nr:hypothetical protein [Gammaproteobacteria bacterium]
MRPLRGLGRFALAGLLAGLAACAHRPTAPAPTAHVIVPAAAPAVAAPAPAPATAGNGPLGGTPTLALPGEWQNQASENYDDLFDRIRAGFALPEVQEPAIDEQL